MQDLGGVYGDAVLSDTTLVGHKRLAETSMAELAAELAAEKAFMCFAPNCGKVKMRGWPAPLFEFPFLFFRVGGFKPFFCYACSSSPSLKILRRT